MNQPNPKMLLFTILLCCSLVHPSTTLAEFYRYITEDGQVYFVDDLTRVPEKYRDQIKTYKESYDHLPAEERAMMLQRDRAKDRMRALEEDKLLEQPQEEPPTREFETDVIIRGNQVLVPVTIGHGNQSNQSLFLLDTGATNLVMFKNFASRFNLKPVKKGVSKVAGGGLVPSELVIIDYIHVGPLRVENAGATVIENRQTGGRAFAFSGLLGIDILRHIEYTIDFQNKKIRWKPKS